MWWLVRARDTHNITITTIVFLYTYVYVGHHRLARAPPPRAPPPRAPPPSSCRRRLERDSASRAPPPRAPPPCVPPPRAPPPCAPPLLRESARINRDKEGLRKQRPHATVASPPSVRPRDVRRLLELLLHLAAIGGALQRQSIAKGLERADERQCPG